MTSEDLTTKQAEKIYEALSPTLGFLTQLERRLLEIGFRPTDGYYGKVKEALNALHRLTIETHYLSCKSGGGRERRQRSTARGARRMAQAWPG